MPVKNVRYITESPIYIGANEVKSLNITVPTSWGSSPTGPTSTLYNSSGTDVTSTNMTGSDSVSGSVITTKQFTGLNAGAVYDLEVKWTDGSDTLECVAEIIGD